MLIRQYLLCSDRELGCFLKAGSSRISRRVGAISGRKGCQWMSSFHWFLEICKCFLNCNTHVIPHLKIILTQENIFDKLQYLWLVSFIKLKYENKTKKRIVNCFNLKNKKLPILWLVFLKVNGTTQYTVCTMWTILSFLNVNG